MIGTCKAETNNLDFNREVDPIAKEIESTLVEHMPPDMVITVRSIVSQLEVSGLLIVTGENLFLKRKILLEKILMIHYYICMEQKCRKGICCTKERERPDFARVGPFFF